MTASWLNIWIYILQQLLPDIDAYTLLNIFIKLFLLFNLDAIPSDADSTDVNTVQQMALHEPIASFQRLATFLASPNELGVLKLNKNYYNYSFVLSIMNSLHF